MAIAFLAHESTGRELGERGVGTDEHPQRLHSERPSDHGGGLKRRLLGRAERVDAGG